MTDRRQSKLDQCSKLDYLYNASRTGQYTIETLRSGDETDCEDEIWHKVFRVFSKNRYPGKLHWSLFFFFFSPEKLKRWFLLKESKPSPDRKMIQLLNIWFTCFRHYDIISSLKLVVEWRRLSRFPAKMTLVHARAQLSLEKISYS